MISKTLCAALVNSGLKLRELAAITAIDAGLLRKFENGKRAPSALSRALSIETDALSGELLVRHI